MSAPRDGLRLTVPAERAGARLDKLLVEVLPGLSRARARALFVAGKVRVERPGGAARLARKGERAQAGQRLLVAVSADELSQRAAADPALPLKVVLERADLVVVDKPAGLPSAPLCAGETGTLAGGLVARYPEMAAVGHRPREPGLCHRLDTATSGLLLAARSAATFEALTDAIAAGRMDKRYLLVCSAADIDDEGSIDLALGPDPRRRGRVACCLPDDASGPQARPRTTRYRVLRRAAERMLVQARACPAYRHQLRVHFAARGAPIVGDELYGGVSVAGLVGHALHASHLAYAGDSVVHRFSASSPLPARLAALLEVPQG